MILGHCPSGSSSRENPTIQRTDPEAVEVLDGLMRSAVAQQTVADASLGAFSKIDSSTIVALMQSLSSRSKPLPFAQMKRDNEAVLPRQWLSIWVRNILSQRHNRHWMLFRDRQDRATSRLILRYQLFCPGNDGDMTVFWRCRDELFGTTACKTQYWCVDQQLHCIEFGSKASGASRPLHGIGLVEGLRAQAEMANAGST